eukprot:7050070-Alexandrium_andersonii.AAC.1
MLRHDRHPLRTVLARGADRHLDGPVRRDAPRAPIVLERLPKRRRQGAPRLVADLHQPKVRPL